MKPKIPQLHTVSELEKLAQVKNLDTRPFMRSPPGDGLLLVKDIQNGFEFHFAVTDWKTDTGKMLFRITRYPYSSDSVDPKESWIEERNLKEVWERWVGLVDYYRTVDPFDGSKDPILEQYQDEFFENFEMLDEDAETKPFDLDKQVLIDRYLGDTIHRLQAKSRDPEISDADRQVYLDLIFKTNHLKETQTTQSQNQTVKELTGIWAYARKKGLKYLEIFKSEAIKELMKSGIKYLIENFEEIADASRKFFE
ncbi:MULTISPECIES: hypothetical protein [Larkinella]|uniref:Uncharacterized protein n=1 Tax=Larkinella humicola TaxID=2607654 RepID=A0A5N1JK93_9BACT|nr:MULTISPECIES: hypothetical protein [Larkinella]KAA9356875.1 hypothetical protein F0P93_03805 [Larkinella humicola]